MENKPHEPPCRGVSLIATTADRVLVCIESRTKNLELPGGGVEDHEDFLTALIRETMEEAMVTIQSGRCLKVAELVQRVPRYRDGDPRPFFVDGPLEVWATQCFKTGKNRWGDHVLMSKDGTPVSNDESDSVLLVRLKDIFRPDSPYKMPLGHKRIILHHLNRSPWEEKPSTGRLSDSISAEVPHFGRVVL